MVKYIFFISQIINLFWCNEFTNLYEVVQL